jgi:hypothetical protein
MQQSLLKRWWPAVRTQKCMHAECCCSGGVEGGAISCCCCICNATAATGSSCSATQPTRLHTTICRANTPVLLLLLQVWRGSVYQAGRDQAERAAVGTPGPGAAPGRHATLRAANSPRFKLTLLYSIGCSTRGRSQCAAQDLLHEIGFGAAPGTAEC